MTADAARPEEPTSGLSLLVIAGGALARHNLPPEGEVVLGRAQDATILLAHDHVSRRHAILHVGPTLRLQDLGSKNGTRVCGRQLAPNETVVLAIGDVVQFGAVSLVVQPAMADAPRSISQAELDAEVVQACARAQPFTLVQLLIERAPHHFDEILRDTMRPTDRIATRDDGCVLLLHAEQAGAISKAITRLRQAGATVRSAAAAFPRDGRDPESLKAVIAAALDRHDVTRMTPLVDALESPMREVIELAERAASGTLAVLLVGETGVGKEIIAELIHQRSARADGPYLCLNCAAMPEAMVESELFGHERGAFTGAAAPKIGLLEAARGGTVLLDEVGELPMPIQAKLLRVLEAREVTRLGSVKPRPIDVRFLAATNRDLPAEIEARRFRKDLYFRLKGVVIEIPPLRDRPADIRRFAQAFIDDLCRVTGRRPAPQWTPESLAALERYDWPGNVRELRNAVERALLLCTGSTIDASHLPSETTAPEGARVVETELRSKLDKLERKRIEDALAQCDGNQSRAAKLLGIARNTLIARIQSYGLDRPRKKPPGG